MRRALLALAVALALGALLALAWWGWQQGGLALLMQGLGAC
jgi:TRAP-type C4-dicarboxylate transport system permease small subunit